MIDFSGLIGLTIKGKVYSGGTGEAQGKVVGVTYKDDKYSTPLVWIVANGKVVGLQLPGVEVVA